MNCSNKPLYLSEQSLDWCEFISSSQTLSRTQHFVIWLFSKNNSCFVVFIINFRIPLITFTSIISFHLTKLKCWNRVGVQKIVCWLSSLSLLVHKLWSSVDINIVSKPQSFEKVIVPAEVRISYGDLFEKIVNIEWSFV